MAVKALDHVTVRTADLAGMIAFYRDILGLQPGPRPPLASSGARLYCGGRAVLHLGEVAETPHGVGVGVGVGAGTGHFAFRAQGLAEFLDRLRARHCLPVRRRT